MKYDIIEMGKVAIETIFTWVVIYPFNWINSLPWYLKVLIYAPVIIMSIVFIIWTYKNRYEFLRRV